MDCQKLIVYGILLLVGLYVLRDVCGVKIPLLEGMNNANGAPINSNNSELLNTPPTPVIPSTVQSVENSQIGVDSRNTGGPSDLMQAQLAASEPQGNEFNLPIQGVQTAPSNCYPQNTLAPQDLLPEGQASEIQQFNEGVPDVGEGILRGVNYLDAGFHVGVNTVGQSLRNANLSLRAEPPNPRSQVSPWMMSTIDPDLNRRPLSDGECNTVPGQTF